jgi:glutathione S-transferase
MPNRTDPPLMLYGSKISYFTGKLEAYLRYKEVPYDFVSMTAPLMNTKIKKATGAAQMPAIEFPDGRWATDTTPVIAWFEGQQPGPAVIPKDPLQAFFSLLVEDYADEWMWRPALYYRWDFKLDAEMMSRRIVDELMRQIPAPGPVKRLAIRVRQRRVNTRGDGVTAKTQDHVEQTYLRAIDQLQTILEQRPFLLGERPTIADFGYFASMFRHFGIDPTPAAIMRERAPAVYAWLARLWDAKASRIDGPLVSGVPDDWGPILNEIGSAYLPYLRANAGAWQAGRRRFDLDVQGYAYRGFRVFHYRVWCLERLREQLVALPAPAREEAQAILEKHGCWAPLTAEPQIASGYDAEGKAPFGVGLGLFDS